MKKNLLLVSKIVLSLVQIPLWFVNLFHGVGHMPNVDTGKIEEEYFYHTMYENISDLGYLFLFYISIVFVFLSINLALLTIFKKNKKINTISNVVTIISIVSFIVILVIASTVARGY